MAVSTRITYGERTKSKCCYANGILPTGPPPTYVPQTNIVQPQGEIQQGTNDLANNNGDVQPPPGLTQVHYIGCPTAAQVTSSDWSGDSETSPNLLGGQSDQQGATDPLETPRVEEMAFAPGGFPPRESRTKKKPKEVGLSIVPLPKPQQGSPEQQQDNKPDPWWEEGDP